MDTQDPDILVDLVGVSDEFKHSQQEQGRGYIRWAKPSETMIVMGAPVWATLRHWKARRAENVNNKVVHFHPLASHSLALPLAFRFGNIGIRPLEAPHQLRQSYESARFENFIELRSIDPSYLDDSAALQLLTQIPLNLSEFGLPKASGQTDFWNLPRLTSIGLPVGEGIRNNHFVRARGWRASETQLQQLSDVVVVSAPNSTEDCCLAWNLRAQQAPEAFLPIWIRPEWFRLKVVQHSIAWAMMNNGALWIDPNRPVHVVSASLDAAEFDKLCQGVPSYVFHPPDSITDFFSSRLEIGFDQDFTEHFFDGTVHLRVPNYELLGDFRSDDRIGLTFNVEHFEPPKIRRLNTSGVNRIATDGFAGGLTTGNFRPGESLTVTVPSAWTLTSQLLNEHGYALEISDKGQVCLAVYELFGGKDGMDLLASSRIYAMLRELASIGVRQAVQRAAARHFSGSSLPEDFDNQLEQLEAAVTIDGQFDRQHVTWSKLKNLLGKDVPDESARSVVIWMIRRGILFRGYEVRCPFCNLRRWYAVDQLAAEHQCDGCRTNMPLPIGVDGLQWRYRLNEIVAHAVDQGVLVHLIAMRTMIQKSGSFDDELLGVAPGVLLSSLNSSAESKIEVDLLAVRNGRLVIGECKSSSSLAREEVQRMGDFAKSVPCLEIVLAAPAELPTEVIEQAHAVCHPVPVVVWNEVDLLDEDHDWLRSLISEAKADPRDYLLNAANALSDTIPTPL